MRNKLDHILAYIFAFLLLIRLYFLFRKHGIPFRKVDKEFAIFFDDLVISAPGLSYRKGCKYILGKTENEFFKQIREDGTLHRIEFNDRMDKL